jgi:hypothetical protein
MIVSPEKTLQAVKLLLFLLFFLSGVFSFITALENKKDLIVDVVHIPGLSETSESGVFVDLVKGINKYYNEGKLIIKVVPILRGYENLTSGKCDIYLPTIYNSNQPEPEFKFRFLDEKLGSNIAVIIYSHVEKIIPSKMIEAARKKGGSFPYELESPPVRKNFFNFPFIQSFRIENSLNKIDRKRIDGAVFIQDAADVALRNLKFKSIHRELLRFYDDGIVIQKGPKSDWINEKISRALREFKKTEEFKNLYERIHPKYTNWQPADMDW